MKIVEKTCKYCSTQFIIEYDGHGKGSGSKTKKAYCSVECEKNQKKISIKAKFKTRICKNCVVCNEEFYVPLSLQKRLCCSNNCRYKHTPTVTTKLEVLNLHCKQCNQEFVSKNNVRKYCSSACSSLAKQRQIVVTCEVCHLQTTVKKSYKPRFCSKSCTLIAQSKGLIATHLNGRSGFRTDINDSPYFKSTFEADYYRYCQQILKLTPEYEKHTFKVELDGKVRFYTPDFFFKETNTFIELKGVKQGESKFSKLLNSNSPARIALCEQENNIQVIYMHDFYSELKEKNLYNVIENLEHRNYGKTKHLIVKRNKDHVN